MSSHPDRLGPYLIQKPLGKGGMGTVYAAVHEEDGDRVAVKMLAPELAKSEGFRERFEAEIESLRTLRHPNIVRLFGYGEEDGALYYSMELVDGISLEEELRAGRRFDWREVTRIAIQVSRALKHAHDHGIIHRDIKPANILLADDKVKLADFGIAQLFGGAKLTTARGVVGTADYMSPEQADSKPITDRCDQYSLGCVMYTLLAGRPPFRARSLPEMLQLQRYAEPEPISRFAPDTPKQLERAVAQLLEKSPKDRFPNAVALAKHLEAMSLAYSRPKMLESEFRLQDHETAPRMIEPADLAETPAVPHSSHDDIREYETLEAPHGGMLSDSSAEAPEEPAAVSTPPARRFVRVIDDPHLDAPRPRLQWLLQAALLLMLIGGVAAVAVFVFWPASADRLFGRITEAAEQGDAELMAARSDVDEFLRRFPSDPRRQQVEALVEQIGFAEAERRIQIMLHRKSQSDSPVESIYLAAMREAKDQPERALGQLRTLIDLISVEGADEEIAEVMLPIARQQAKQLEKRIARRAKEQMPFLRERLEKAQALADSDPAAARAICRAVVDLYGERDWAQDPVQEAKSLLSQLDAPR